MKIENVVYNIESALNAEAGGADRIELCDNPSEGGTTPSIGIVDVVRRKVNIDVYVMIRPRGGDFVYSHDEFEAMKADIVACKRLGVDGFVFGILTADGKIDVERCGELILLAKPMGITCHRAFDFTRDAYEALEDCKKAGFDRILTSGRMPNAEEGAELIKALVSRTKGGISIMAGVGINEKNVRTIVRQTGVSEIHFSAKDFRLVPYARYNHLIGLLDYLPSDGGTLITNADKVRRIKEMFSEK